jgi:hypothetical protein
MSLNPQSPQWDWGFKDISNIHSSCMEKITKQIFKKWIFGWINGYKIVKIMNDKQTELLSLKIFSLLLKSLLLFHF